MSGSNKKNLHALAFVGTCLLGFIAYAAGCSVPDRTFYDDTGGSGGNAPNGGTGNSNGGSSPNGGRNNGGGNNGGTGNSANGGSGNATAEGGDGGDNNIGTDRPNPTKGLIVIGGTEVDETKGVISVIAPDTGKELVRESLPNGTQVAAIGYDGADKIDLWYIFVSAAFPAKADKTVDLQIRYYADAAGKWVTLGHVSPLPPPIPGTVTVLNNRLAYLSNVSPTPALVILDTTDPAKPTTITNAYVPKSPFTGTLTTLIGTRGTASDPTSVGGTLDVGLAQTCAGTTCSLFIQPIAVGDSIVDESGDTLGQYKNTPLAYSNRLSQQDYFALAPVTGTVKVYPITPDTPEAAVPFMAPQEVPDLVDMTVAECQNTAIFTGKSENTLYGVTLSVGAGVKLDLGREGQLVAYEPFTRGVISTYNPPTDDFKTAAADAGIPGPAVDAIDVTSPSGSNLKITARATSWDPPTDLRANVLTTRFPLSFKCP